MIGKYELKSNDSQLMQDIFERYDSILKLGNMPDKAVVKHIIDICKNTILLILISFVCDFKILPKQVKDFWSHLSLGDFCMVECRGI
ncbi:MAG: hypothetical protein LBS39_04005, partial [Campylobacteraceae bacterium]|nr:hypothetical protein [Campylobacteraceae bacterium]